MDNMNNNLSYYEGAKNALQLMVGNEATITVDNGYFTVTLSEETFRYPIDMFSWRYEDKYDTPVEEPELDLKTRLKIKHGLLPPPPEPELKTAEEKYCEAKGWIHEKSGLTLEEAVEFITQYRSVYYHPPVA